MKSLALLLLIVTSFFFVSVDLMGANAKYLGVQSCGKGPCHGKKKNGDALKQWKNTKHAGAYDLLGTTKAKKLAATVNVMSDPQTSIECLICHSAGAGLPENRFKKSFFKTSTKKGFRSGKENGVQCENCHGPGSRYKQKKIMKQLRKEHRKGGDQLANKVGMVRPTERTCKQCHVAEIKVNGVTYKNPSFKSFDFKKRIKQILHPMP